MTGTLSRATQVLYRVNPRTSSDVDTLTLDADGLAVHRGRGREATARLPAALFAEIIAKLEQYSFKSVSGVHGDAMADYQHEIEVLEAPVKRSRCTLRVNHEAGALLGAAPTGMKEMVKLLELIGSRVQFGGSPDERPERVTDALLRQVDFPYVNPHGAAGALALIDRAGALLPVSSQRLMTPYGSVLLPVRVEESVGFVRANGELAIPAAFSLTLGFCEGLAAVKLAEGWGYVDPAGRMVIAPQFAAASNFHDGLAHVHRGHHGGFIDARGEFFADPPHASQVGRFAGGFAPYRALSRIGVPAWGYIDRRGAVVLPPTYDQAGEFSEGLAAVQQDDLYGYIDASFAVVVAPQFTEAGALRGGLAPVEVDGVTGYCDRTGALVIAPQFTRGGVFAEDLAPVFVGGRAGYIDRSGRMVIAPGFEAAMPFSEGLAAVRVDHRWGYVDRSGRMVIAPTFEGALPFADGLACARRFAEPKPVVHTGSKKVIINLGGKPKS